MRKGIFLCLAAASLTGCSAIAPQQPPPLGGVPPPPVKVVARKGQAGGVFVAETISSLTADRRALRPGDVLTVALNETTQASKKADTQFGKGSTVDIQPAVIAGKTNKVTNIGLESKTDFSGSSASTQQNSLIGAITVVVQEVLPNGLLLVQGEKNLYLNQGEEMVRLSGYVRAEDIDNENQVSSQRIANARIVYSGTGALADANNPGWLTRFFVNPWFPF